MLCPNIRRDSIRRLLISCLLTSAFGRWLIGYWHKQVLIFLQTINYISTKRWMLQHSRKLTSPWLLCVLRPYYCMNKLQTQRIATLVITQPVPVKTLLPLPTLKPDLFSSADILLFFAFLCGGCIFFRFFVGVSVDFGWGGGGYKNVSFLSTVSSRHRELES